MFDQEDFDYEFNARYDYIAELVAEHRDDGEEDYGSDEDYAPNLRGDAFWYGCACGPYAGMPF